MAALLGTCALVAALVALPAPAHAADPCPWWDPMCDLGCHALDIGILLRDPIGTILDCIPLA